MMIAQNYEVMLVSELYYTPNTRVYLYCIQSFMESQSFQKQMFSTNRKEKIFNVRKVPYKQFQNQKYLKANFSPFQKKQTQREPTSTQPKKGDYLALTATPGSYREINKKYTTLKEQLHQEKQRRLQKLKQREEELHKIKAQNERLHSENLKLQQRRQEIKAKLEQLRERNEIMRQEQLQRNQQIRQMNMQYLTNMVMGMRYQNGIEIDTDNMTYEELLQLQEKIGKVSKGISEEQINLIKKVVANGIEQVCSVCYYNIKDGEEINQLPCQHCYHVDCIKEWLLKQRTCPLCKQQIFETAQQLLK